MKIKELSLYDFNQYAARHPLASHYQTMNYALIMGEEGYDHDFIGYVDETGKIYAASLILIKKIKPGIKYGYAPKGFLIDYYNRQLLNGFTTALCNYYRKRRVAFIKINPEIAICEYEYKSKRKLWETGRELYQNLEDAGYIKLKDNLYFESMFPRFNAVIPLKDFSLNQVTKNTRNKIKRGIAKGLEVELAERSGLDILQNFIRKKRDCNIFYYKDYYNSFHKDDMIDLFLVSINAQDYLTKARDAYEQEVEKNTIYNKNLLNANTTKNINQKMMSDKKILAYKNDVYYATELNKKGKKIYVAGALVLRFKNRAHILISGYDKKYRAMAPNYYLHYAIIEYYKKNYSYLDLNGLTGDFEKDNPYYGLNEFKLGFKPQVYEFIGEFDLPIKLRTYKKLRASGQLAKIFNKKDLKVTTK